MRVAFAADHAGWPLRHRVLAELDRHGHDVVDCGTGDPEPGDDYPVRAVAVAHAILEGRAERGILMCGSGVGAAIAANKIRHIKACMCHDTFSARQGVEDDDMNVLCLGARAIGEELAAEVLAAFLNARFSGVDRHVRRVAMVDVLDRRES